MNGRAVGVRVENRRMDVAFPAHGLRVAEALRDRFDRAGDLTFRMGFDPARAPVASALAARTGPPMSESPSR